MARVALLVMLAACSDPAAIPDAGVDPSDAPAGTLAVSPVGREFGDYEVGSNDPAIRATFEIGNTGTIPATITTIEITGPAASEFTIDANDCGDMLAPSEGCTVRVAFIASASGERVAMLQITGSTAATATLSGMGTSSVPRIRFTPPSRNFGDVAVGGTSGLVTFVVANEVAPTTLTPSLIGPGAGAFRIVSTDCATATVPLHGTCTMMVEMVPTFGGQFVGDLVLTESGGTTWTAGVTGASTTPLQLSPYGGFFTSMLVGQTEPGDLVTFTLTNTGATTTGPLTATPVGAAAADFTVRSTTCTTLAPMQSCTVVVEFTANTTRGAKLAQLSVADPTTETRSSLRGDAYALLVVGTATFPSTASGQQSATQSYSVINASSHVTGAITTTRTGADASQFTIVSNGCAAGLAAHTQCTIVMRFAPTSTGAKAMSLDVASTPGGSDTFAITATGL